MTQSRLMSLVETLTNIAIGMAVSFVSNLVILPLVLGVYATNSQLGIITVLFTAVSLVRGYVLRRWFAKRTG